MVDGVMCALGSCVVVEGLVFACVCTVYIAGVCVLVYVDPEGGAHHAVCLWCQKAQAEMHASSVFRFLLPPLTFSLCVHVCVCVCVSVSESVFTAEVAVWCRDRVTVMELVTTGNCG